MILRCTRSSLPLYGLLAMIAFTRAGPTPGSLSSSSALAEFISTNCPACADLVAAVEFGELDGQTTVQAHYNPSAAGDTRPQPLALRAVSRSPRLCGAAGLPAAAARAAAI